MRLMTLAARNVVRNWRRSIVTTGAMAFAAAIMILFASLMAGLLRDSERNAVTMNLGDLQIHASGYRDDPDLYKRIDDAQQLVARLQQQGFHASQRLYGFGLAAAGTTSAGVQLRGVDIDNENSVTQMHRHLVAGEWLTETDPHGVIIGRKLARSLGVRTGDEIIFVGQASDGSMANDLYRVRGILKSIGEEVDRAGLFMTLDAFRQLMVLPDGAHEIAVLRANPDSDLDLALHTVTALAPGYETLDWRQLSPVVARILEMADVQTIVMVIITYIAVATIVLNAMLMSVFERIQEFGVMKAVGVTPWQIFGLVYLETLWQTATAATGGSVIGYAIAVYYQTHGIDLSNIASSASFGGIALDPLWRAYITADSIVIPVLFLFLIAGLAVIYPALKAALIRPVSAIHHR